jgi:catechol 2,3-dioxygenase-like lactoylglutathione lyase family enzyme
VKRPRRRADVVVIEHNPRGRPIRDGKERSGMLENSRAFSGFSVDDIAEAKRFYGETLGLRVTEENGMLTLHTAGDHTTLIYPKEDHTPATYTTLNFPVEDVDTTVEDLTARGVAFERYQGIDQDERGVFRGGGPLIAWFKDPADNILSIIQG